MMNYENDYELDESILDFIEWGADEKVLNEKDEKLFISRLDEKSYREYIYYELKRINTSINHILEVVNTGGKNI